MRQLLTAFITGFLIATTCAITIYMSIIVPGNSKRLADAEKRVIESVDASRIAIYATRDALSRAEGTNRELTKRIAELTKYTSTSIDITNDIANGIDGDIEAAGGLTNAIRQAMQRVRELPTGSQ